LRGIVATMPIEWLLLETDSPDQPTAMHRGERNVPGRLVVVLDAIEPLRGETGDKIAEASRATAERLFGLT
jgi:TatD DNase family protein